MIFRVTALTNSWANSELFYLWQRDCPTLSPTVRCSGGLQRGLQAAGAASRVE